MFNKLLVVGMLCLTLTGCASLQPIADKYVPIVTARLAANGVAVHVDPGFGFESFCLDPVGTAADLLAQVPVLGQFVTGFVGLCDAAPVE